MATGLAIIDETVHAILRDWPAITALQTAPEVMVRNFDVDVRDEDEFAWPGRPQIWVSPLATAPTNHPYGTGSLRRLLRYRVRMISPGSLADYRALEDATFGALAKLCHYDQKADSSSIHADPPTPWLYESCNVGDAIIDRADQYGITGYIDIIIKITGDAATLTGTSGNAPLISSGTVYQTRGLIYLNFDKPIAAIHPPVVVTTNFSFCRGDGFVQEIMSAAHPVASSRVMLNMNFPASLTGCSGGPKITYLAATPLLIGANGVNVAAFANFSLASG